MIEDPSAQRVVDLNHAILKSRGGIVSAQSVILDFGCGSGRHTYEYLDAGFPNAFGYDVKNYVKLRSAADIAHFRFDPMPADRSDYPPMSEIPWPDDVFDFAFATSVFEHVREQKLAFSEIHRVLKPGGWFLNVFPSKWRPIEAHTDVPFGGVFNSPGYLRLCATLGIRGNLYEENFTVDQLVDANRYFFTHGVNYLSGRQIADVLQQTFGEFEYVEDAFVDHSPGRSRHLAIPLKLLPVLRHLFRFAHTRVVLARKRSFHEPV